MGVLVVFSVSDLNSMVSLIKDSINELNRMDRSHSTYLVSDKLNEVLTILTKEDE